MFPARWISFAVGFLSLGAETLWIRTYGFANESLPGALAAVLAVYLVGIAAGAAIGGEKCRDNADLVGLATVSILAASLLLMLTPAMIWLLPRNNVLLLGLVTATAMSFAISFPICHHLGTDARSERTGRSLSRVYAANIAGSVIGPLATNFGLLQIATTQTAFMVLGAAGAALALALVFANTRASLGVSRASILGFAAAIGGVWWSTTADNHLIAKLALAQTFPIRHIVETRQGIVVAHADDTKGDIIFGGNVYDGRTNTDLRINSNGLNRIAMISALVEAPKRVLVIGLSVGSWLHVIRGFPGVEQIDVVEINPGYLDLIANYDAQRKAIADKRVHIIVGDGRKFLRQNPDRKYDMIVMNTTLHWRMYASLLLSREYLSMVRSHMSEGAVLTFNTTESPDALETAASVFEHAYLYDNFAVAAAFDWRRKLDAPDAAARLRQIKPAGKPIVTEQDEELVRGFLGTSRVRDLASVRTAAGRPLEVITDRNLITEYRYGR